MSKQGVQLTQEQRKPRRRVQLEERDGVVGKGCSKCGEWKSLGEYHKQSSGLGGTNRFCKICKNTTERRKIAISEKQGVLGKICSKCNDWKPLSEYHANKNGVGSVLSCCKQCVTHQRKIRYKENIEKEREESQKYYKNNYEKLRISARKYRENNIEKVSRYQREYRENNRHVYRLAEQRRKARKQSLPDSMSSTDNVRYSTCFLTTSVNTNLEHAIPISVGHGGTTYGNIYGLRKDLNESKNDSNIFEWFDANRQRFELSQSKFDNLISYLAVANGLTVEEYRNFYDWCFANPRTVDEIKADLTVNGQRHSIEIWREASGQQFPLPAYTETYNSTGNNESEAI